ncbi:V-type ATP synthase subunit E [Oscillospiraceae bacterium OttesenSCG-928-F05]|nr:V-type ATP synthase subunit E [Oscillospiraceae bacterium OttesenSCG-928-F05]
MSTSSDKLDKFIASILADANKESAEILDDIRSRRTTYMSAMEDEILTEMYDYVRAKVNDVRTQAGRSISKKTLDNKRVLFGRRQQIEGEVMAQVRTRLEAYVTSPAYTDTLKRSIKTAETLLGGGLVVYVRPQDLPLVDKLGVDGVTFEADEAIELGGILAEHAEQHRGLDLSFDSALESASGQFARISGFGLSHD